MKALVTGATGFTGSYVVPRLVKEGVAVRCFAREPGRMGPLARGVEVVKGDLDDPATLASALGGCDVLVNIASLGFGHAPGIVQAARAASISRALFISTTAIFTALNAPSKTVRLAAEQSVITSGLCYTILRPTMIYGSSRDRNICRLIRYLRSWPAIPVFGTGRYLQQPVYVGDLADAVVQALLVPGTANKSYNISGATAVSYNEVIDTVCTQLKRRVARIHIPAKPIVGLLQTVEKITRRLPIKAEQIQRLNEDKAFSHVEAARDFGYRPKAFQDGVRLELEEMGLLQ